MQSTGNDSSISMQQCTCKCMWYDIIHRTFVTALNRLHHNLGHISFRNSYLPIVKMKAGIKNVHSSFRI